MVRHAVSFLLAATILACLSGSAKAQDGANAFAKAFMYWADSTGVPTDSTSAFGLHPRLLITAKGLHSLKSFEFQIWMKPCATTTLPGAWIEGGTKS